MSLAVAAADACAYVRRELPLGARNIRNQHRGDTLIDTIRDRSANTGVIADGRIDIAGHIEMARRFGAGNCMEMAYMTFDYLRKTRPNDSIALVSVHLHMSVCAPMNLAAGTNFDASEIDAGVIFIDEWLRQWVANQQAEGAGWVQNGDLTGVYSRDRFCQLIDREGEDVERCRVLRKDRVGA